MTNIELPKDAEGREIPLDTEVLYNEDGKRFEVNRSCTAKIEDCD